MKAGVVNCFKIRTFKPVYTPVGYSILLNFCCELL